MIQWNDGLSLGVKVLDDDHKKLLKIINHLSEAIDNDAKSDEFEIIFADLEDYTIKHFQREESFIKQCSYESYDEHCKQHQSFANKIPDLKEKFFATKSYINAKEITTFLTDWLINHIITEDMPLVESFKKCGICENKKQKESWFIRLIKKINSRITFTRRLVFSAVIPLIGMIIFASFIIIDEYNKYTRIEKMSNITYTIFGLNELSHSLQIERGLSSGHISSKNNKFIAKLNKQRKISNKNIEMLINNIEALNLEKNNSIIKSLNTLEIDVATLKNIRKKVDNKTVAKIEEINFYKKMIKNIIFITSKIMLMNTDKEISNSLSTLSSILNMKEIMGLQRAQGIIIIEQKASTNDEHTAFVELSGAKRTYRSILEQTATLKYKKTINNLLTTPLVNQILDYKLKIIDKKYENLDSKVWFELTTEHINNINKFINYYIYDIYTLVENNLNNTKENIRLWIAYIFIILFATTLIIFIFVKATKKQIDKITEAIEDLANGGRSLRLECNVNQDVIHKIYCSYEVTRQNLLKGDIINQLFKSQENVKLNYEKRVNIKLEKEVIHDGLTDLFNRRYYDEIVEKELNRAKRDKLQFTFVMLDIDFFKPYNDTYGHQEGDNTLKAVAKLLKSKLSRSGDFCFRLGGEEFGFFFAGESLEESIRYTNEICMEVEKLHIPHSKNSVSDYVTASFGLLSIDTQSSTFDTHAIYIAADKALYRAKEEGRNRVIIYEGN
ncbi:MAG: bacteriohemerythrin [Helicobacteraceae bacterium]|nr:bacteriohemerythrin [Helicobacteraceae bacterium]